MSPTCCRCRSSATSSAYPTRIGREIFDTLDRILSANSPDSQLTEQDQLELFGKIFTYALRTHRGEAAQSGRRHLEHADDRGGHRRERRAAVHTRQRARDLLLRDRLRGQRHDEERAGRRTCRRSSRIPGRSSAIAPTRRSDRARSKRCCAGRRRWRSGRAARRSTWRWTASPSRRAIGWCRCCARPTATKRSSSDPFTFDIGRADNPHVTFGGGGPHHCLGAMLARAEIRAVLDELLCRADDITLGLPKVALSRT